MLGMDFDQIKTILSTTIEYPIITDDRMTKMFEIELTKWQKFKTRIEDLAEKSGIIYPFQKVERFSRKPVDYVIFLDGKIYCHPSMYHRLKRLSKYYQGNR